MDFSIKTLSDGTKELYVDKKLIASGTQEEILTIMRLMTQYGLVMRGYEITIMKPRKEDEGKMKEVTEILRLLVKAIEQSTVNTYQEQGSAAADVVFCILEDAEKRIDTLDRKTEKGGKQE